MKLNKRNKKGVTLVEVIIAMTLMGMMAGMLVTIAVQAKNTNRDNYIRSREMNTQAVDAEQYNNNKNYNMNEIKVNKYVGAGQADNTFNLEADFGSGVTWNTKAYGFKSKLNEIDKDAGYQMKFLQAKDANVAPDASNGIYWVKFYNDSGVELANYVETPEITGGSFFDVNKNVSGNKVIMSTGIGGVSQFGFIYNSAGGDYFGFTETNDAGLYDSSHTPSASDYVITSAEFDKFCEKDASLNNTGYVTIHYMGGSTYYNQAEYDAYMATPTPTP